MPYQVVWEPKGVVKHVSGDVTPQEFMQSIVAVQNDPRFDSARYSINSFVDAQALQITESDIHMYAATSIGAAVSNPNIRICIVASDPAIIALIAVYTKLSPYKTVFFESISEARAWLTAQGIAQPAT